MDLQSGGCQFLRVRRFRLSPIQMIFQAVIPQFDAMPIKPILADNSYLVVIYGRTACETLAIWNFKYNYKNDLRHKYILHRGQARTLLYLKRTGDVSLTASSAAPAAPHAERKT